MLRRPMGRGPTVLQQRARQDPNAPRDFDKVISNLGTIPRILCWKCRKLTPFDLDRCEHCGSPFAGSTGGVYGSDRRSRPRATSPPKPSSGPRKRTLLEIVEDLRHVNEGTTSVRGRPREKELSVRLYQCPTCGRFVSEQSTECVCGVRLAPLSARPVSCSRDGARVPPGVGARPGCRPWIRPPGEGSA